MAFGEVPARDGVGSRFVAFARRRRWLVGAVALLLVALVVVVVLRADGGYPRAAGPARCSAAAAHTAALPSLVMPIPADARPEDVTPGRGTTLTLVDTAELARDSKSRYQELQQDGFVDATDQAWFYGDTGSMVNVRLMRFSTADGSAAFFAATVARIGAVYGTARELPGVPGSFYFQGDVPHGDPAITMQGRQVGEHVLGPVGYALSYATICVGDIVAVIYLWEPGPDRALARAIAREQHARL